MKYYYLISSLPELEIDNSSLSQEQLFETIEVISRNLTPEDQVVLNCLLQPNDNRNLLYILFREYHDFEIRSFSGPVSIPIEVLENYRREYSSLPDYMINYLNDLSGTFSSLSLREMEYKLGEYFHEYLLNTNSIFLHTFYAWQFKLRKTVSEINLKSYPFLHTRNEEEEFGYPGTKILHTLTDQSEITNQLVPLVEANDLEAIENKINGYYWEFANSWQEPFSAEQVFAYVVKLIRLYRWKGFSSKGELAKAKFEELIMKLKQSQSSPKMPVI